MRRALALAVILFSLWKPHHRKPCPPPGQYGCFVCSGHVICVDPPPRKR